MSAVTMSLRGGERFKNHLRGLARGLGTARTVRVGFLEGASYPQGDAGARLARAARRFPQWWSLFMSWARWQYRHPTDLSVAQVAFWDEFGTSGSHPRPFFRRAIRRHSGEWGAKLARYLRGSGFDARTSLGKLGLLIGEQVRESIMSWPADNAPITVAVKGFNRGLIDRGVMARSVDHEVVGR